MKIQPVITLTSTQRFQDFLNLHPFFRAGVGGWKDSS